MKIKRIISLCLALAMVAAMAGLAPITVQAAERNVPNAVLPSDTFDEGPGYVANGLKAAPSADVWDGTVDTSWYNSTDTEFTIYTAEQLAGLAELVNNGNSFSGKTVNLGNDIELAGLEWTPIGQGSTSDGSDYATCAFSGTFNGNGHYVFGLNVNTTSLKRAGLFGTLNYATITTLGVQDANIAITQQHIVSGGVIAGTANYSTISKCDVSGNVSVTDTNVGNNHCAVAGMIVGTAGSSVMIESCAASGSVSGSMPNDWNAYVGGIVGRIYNERIATTISKSYFYGQVYAYGYDTAYAGGIVGLVEGSTSISDCFAVADITSSDYADAIASKWEGYSPATTNSYYSSATSSSLATSTSSANFQSQSWIETNLGWDFDTVWEFGAGNEYPVLQGFNSCVHDYEETSRTEATCTEPGCIVYTCTVCGREREEVYEYAYGHSYENGYCTNCGEHLFADAIVIGADESAYVAITESYGYVYFSFTPSVSGQYQFYSSNRSGDPYVELYDTDGNLLTSNDDGGGNLNFSIYYDCMANTTYFIKARMLGSGTGYYTFHVATIEIYCDHDYILQSTTTVDCENDGIYVYACSLCGDSYEEVYEYAYGHSYENGYCTNCGEHLFADAIVIGADESAYVEITESYGYVYFSFTPSVSGQYHFYSSDRSGDPYGELYEGNGDYVTGNDDGEGNLNFSIYYECVANTTYFIKARMLNNGTGYYTFHVATIETYCDHEYIVESNIPADCDSHGVMTYVCSFCGDSYEEVYEYAYGHNYVDDVCVNCGAEKPLADVWDGTVDTSWYNSEDTAFTIYTAEQLAGLAELVNNGNTFSGKTIYLGSDIDLAGLEWTPIGKGINTSETYVSQYAFQGSFNGNYHTVANMTIRNSQTTFAGFFGCLYGAVNVSNLGIVNACIDITRTVSYRTTAGILAGATGGDVNISSCFATGTVNAVCTGDNIIDIGGFVGDCYDTEFINCYCVADVSADGPSRQMVGVFCGWGDDTMKATNCFSYGDCVATGSGEKYVDAFAGGDMYWSSTNTYYCSSISDRKAAALTESQLANRESFVGWDFDTVWEFKAGGDYPVLRGFDDSAPHDHGFEEISRTEATCTTDGRIEFACSCGYTKYEIMPATGHNIETVIESQVTCTTDGLIVDRCTNDGCDYEKRTVIHGEHNYSVTDRQEATCTVDGYIEYTCSNCADQYYEYIEGVHDYVETSRVDPQIEVEGSITYTCTYCQDSYSIVIPALTPVLKNTSVLLIQDALPWGEDVNTVLLETLKDRGVVSSYNIINTSALESFDLSQYGVVFIANDQSTTMYNRLAASADKLENYVRAGGNLIYGACDEGWCGGSLTHTLPGGVTTSNYYSVYNYIVNDLHPIVTGVYTDNVNLREELLKGNYCSHTYFNTASLPDGTDIILRDANGNPTLIEYTLGEGTVIASGLTWEFFYIRTHYNMNTNYSKCVFDDLITYMVYMSNPCEHSYEIVETVEATCVNNGYTKYVCSNCSYEYMSDVVVAPGHNYVATVVEPTYETEGYTLYTCENCGNSYMDDFVDPLDPADGMLIQVGSTEAAPGEYFTVQLDLSGNTGFSYLRLQLEYDSNIFEYVSATNGTVAMEDFTAAKNLLWIETYDTMENGLLVEITFRVKDDAPEGYYGIDATVKECYNEQYDEVAMNVGAGTVAVTHSFVTEVTEPTCVEGGYTTYTCVNCGYSYVGDYVEALDHDFVHYETMPATCMEDGFSIYLCSRCDESYTETIFATGHVYEGVVTEPTCTEQGYTTYTCVYGCGDSYVADYTDPHGHSYVDTVVEPTFESEGYTLHTCEYCDDSYMDNFVPKLVQYGDVNGDGRIDGRDLLKLKRYLANYDDETGTSTEEVSSGADVNGDGKIDGRDLLKLKRYLANYDDETGTSTEPLGPTPKP